MPRANRHHLPGYVWHITHRCHGQEFLLKFRRDRRLWRYWLYQARRRYGLCVLNYIVTADPVHLRVRDEGRGEIPRAMQLIAGRVGRSYNRRKSRKGAFWEDRYHATAVETRALWGVGCVHRSEHGTSPGWCGIHRNGRSAVIGRSRRRRTVTV